MRTLISWLLFACTVASDCDVKEIAEHVERGPAQAECLLQRSGQLGEALAFEEDGLPCAGFCAGNSKPWEKKCNWRKCKGCAACAQPAGCLPSTTFSGWGDAGYPDNFRGWYDVQGCGKCHDYCRWVGASGSGGDPKEKLTHQQSYWSCRLAGTSAIHSPNGAFQSWNFDKCSGEGAVAPAPAPPATPYVPGSPGAAWSEHELRVVRAKIHRIINEGDKVFDELGLQVEERWTSVPSAGKLLRLGFHDCLRYKDGTGGCDGCLEWKGVGVRIPRADLERGKFPGDGEGDGHNNGLGYVVEVLEAIYTDRSFPGKTPQLSLSLQQSGKSRADLWAFAAIVAVEYSLELNNMVCDNPTILQPDQCHPREGQPDCSIARLPRPIIFKTGRTDCLSTGSPYKQGKEEAHPDPQANGQATAAFFKRDFNLAGRRLPSWVLIRWDECM
ncbi:unnamed protein product [Effrenium voratum]|nr:unnamed protein product [Effrenium voratum]